MNAIARLDCEIDELAAISAHPAPAVTRVLFSPEDLAARQWLTTKAKQAGFLVRTDPAGNLFIRWEGSEPCLPAVATGSHTDAIPNAGKYLEFSIEGPDYYPWQEGLFRNAPYTIRDGKATIPAEPGWGIEIDPAWLDKAAYAISSAG